MNKLKKADYIIIAVIVILITGIVLATVLSGESDTDNPGTGNTSSGTITMEDFNGRIMGIRTGSSFEQPTIDNFPDSEYQYFDTSTDLMMALQGDKIDGFMEDEPVAKMMCINNHDLAYFKDPVVVDNYSFAFPKDSEKADKQLQQFNEMLKELWASGEIDRMIYKWMEGPESERTIDKSGITGENGELLIALPNDCPPFSYYYNNELTGYAIELCTRFAQKYGYSLKFEEVKFASMITGISTGKYDIAANSISVTEERKKSMNFSDTFYKGGMMVIVRNADAQGADVITFGENSSSGNTETKDSYMKFDGKKLGIWTGTAFEKPTLEKFPNSEYFYFDHDTDMMLALETGKIDGFIIDEPIARMACKENPNLGYYKEIIVEDNYCFGFTKGSEKGEILASQFNEIMKELWDSGEADRIITKWMDGPEDQRTFDRTGLTGENGELFICVLSDNPPFSYYYNNELTGYAMELCYMMARRYGYSLKIEETSVSAGIAGLAAGKYDVGAMSFSPTEERKKSMYFGDVFYKGGHVFMCRKADIGTGNATTSDAAASGEPEYTEYDGKTIGIQTGSSFEPVTLEKFPNSKYVYFENNSDLILALEQGKIDAFVEDEPVARMINIEKPNINYLKKVLVEDDYSIGFQKDTETSRIYRKQFNDMLSELWANGEIDRLIDKWFDENAESLSIDTSGLTGENGELLVAARSNKPPFSYFENGEYKGYGIELATMFARKYGYSIKYEDTNLSAMLAGLTSEKYDMGISSISVTEERKKSIDFSDTFYKGGMVLVIRNEDIKTADTTSVSDQGTEEKPGFFESVKDSFEKNFIKEDRWKLILQGVGTTCAITALTVLFGSILAFLICMFRRVNSVLAEKICNLYVKLLQGTPMVVLLMILYYIVFGKSSFDAIWVAVIGFSLNFGAYGSEIMRSGIESIDKGQREAALALGFTENQGFFKFIFPQAAVRFLPVYRGEIISLLKNTSIVGYIAIQDLTKMSDIIRSRTFEAFFPLISTAIIYFILAWIISIILAKILKVVDPKQKKKTVKGVKM